MTDQHSPSRIRILSDLHLNNRGWQAPSAPADMVILAGDISNGTAGLYWARENFSDLPIVYVSGNQELYGHNVDELAPQMRALAKELDIHFLEQDVCYFAGLRILGTTLWTDFDLFGQSARWLAINKPSSRAPRDRKDIFSNKGRVTPLRKIRWHDISVAWLKKELERPFDGKTVVVTHHVPTMLGLPNQYLDDLSSAAFASNLDWLLPYADLWVCGHTHTATDFIAEGCRVVINPRGRTLSSRNGFNPELVIEVQAQTAYNPRFTQSCKHTKDANMLEQVLTEDDITWLAKILAMIPGLPVPPETIEKLQKQELITPRGDGWEATEKGIITITSWQPN